jgi:hypothetical protein
MAIETIPHPEPKESYFLRNFLLFLGIIFLILSLASYFLIFSLEKNSSQTLAEYQEKVNIAKKKAETQGSEIKNWKEKIEDYKYILSLHKINSGALTLLEKTVHPKLWFSSLDLAQSKNQLKVGGFTPTFLVLAEQAEIFRNEKQIDRVDLIQVSQEKTGMTKFEFNLLLNPIIFQP